MPSSEGKRNCTIYSGHQGNNEDLPVKLIYDPRYNVAYIRLKEKTADVESVHISEEVKIHLAPDDTVYGIELLNANE